MAQWEPFQSCRLKVIEITLRPKWNRFVSYWVRQLTFRSSILEPWVTGVVISQSATPVPRVMRSAWVFAKIA